MPLACSRRTFLTAAATLALAPAGAEPVSGPRLLEAREGSLRLLPDFAPATPIWGFDGVAPGPLLRARQNDELTVRLANRLDKPMSVHWHGLRGDNAMDGVAPLTQAPIAPGAQFDYRCKTSDAGLFCYRPSVWGLTSELMGRGLKGLLIIDEPHPAAADVDLATVLDDWRLNADGKIEGGFDDAAPAFSAGRIGALVTVNGKPAPSTHDLPPGGRVRLRLANLANARIMIVSFDGVQPFVLAVDSQPCDAFEPLQRTIPLAPGARFEIMFDAPAQEGARASMILRGQGEADRDLLVFTTKGAKAPERDKIASAPQNLLLPAEIKLAASKKIDLVIEPPRPDASAATTAAKSWMINGASSRAYDGAPLFQVKRGTPVTLGFNNRAGVAIVMHVHGHAVRLLHDLDDGWEPYWRNGVVVPGGKTKHVAFVADNPGKWALHDDILEHEASGLATWFEV
ncbi:MAG: multicopper oxidase family protein, partial [Methylocystis sp.]|nr:multicopper oxidase family protein [Methylocystis sp.]